MPGEYVQLPETYRMLLIRILRPDRLVPTLERVLLQTLHVTSVAASDLRIESVTPATPGLFLCDRNVDVCQELTEASKTHSLRTKRIDLVVVSMREGLEATADRKSTRLNS